MTVKKASPVESKKNQTKSTTSLTYTFDPFHYVKCGPVPNFRNWRDLPTSELTRAERNMRFCERYLRIASADGKAVPLRLKEFQEAFFYSVFDNPAGTRKAIYSVGRKNGKSYLISCILLCFLIGPEARLNAQIVSGAMSRDQAAIIFKQALQMIQLSPEISNLVKVIPSKKALIGLALNTEYMALAADGSTTVGLDPQLILVDECGQIVGETSEFISALSTSQGARQDPLIIYLSTQAPTDSAFFSREIDDAISSQDPRVVCHLYSAPDDCELTDREAWAMANPALGIFRSEQDIEDSINEAVRMPSKESITRVYLLNQRVNMEQPFVTPKVWKENGSQPESLKGKKVWGGLDLSAVSDLTCLALVSETYDVECTFWLPKEGLREKSKSDRVPYDVWYDKGFLRTTPGRSIEYEFIAHELRYVFDNYDVQQINFDRALMRHLRPWLVKVGFTEEELEKFVDFGQGFLSMHPAVRDLESLLLQKKLKHGMHPVLTMCAGNVRVETDAAGSRKFTKKKSTGRIDGMVALTMAVAGRCSYKATEEKEYKIFFV